MEGEDKTRHYSLERNSAYGEGGNITYLREWNNCLYWNIRRISTHNKDFTAFSKEGISMNEHEIDCFLAVYEEIENIFCFSNDCFQDRVFRIGETMMINCFRTTCFHQTMDFRRIKKSESGENIYGNGIILKGNAITRFFNYCSSMKEDFNWLRHEKTTEQTKNSMEYLSNQIDYKNLFDTVF